MAKKMLGKVVAGAALGSASLLVFAPGIAFADGHHDDGKDRDGKVFAKPHVVKAGDEVKLLEICSERQEHAFVWSKVTGKVKLKPVHDEHGKDDKDDKDEHGKDEHGKDDRDKDHEGKDEHGKDDKDKDKDEHGKDDKGKDHDGKDENGKDDKDKDKDEHGKDENGTGKPQPPNGERYGQGGGAAADEGSKDWKGEEHGQDAEDSRDKKDWESKDEDKKDRDSKDHDKKDWDSKDQDKKDWESKDEDKKDRDSKDHDKKDRDSKDHDKKDWESKDEDKKDRDSKDHDKKDWDSKDEDKKDRDSKDHDKKDWEHKKDFVYYGEAKVDKDARPGRHELKGSCGEGELVVLPRGGVDGGDGGASTGTDRGLATGGASLLGAAALGGIVLMRRRRTDGSLV
ncbi:hypothetical protein [Micromonospora sp. NPDC005173]|uniref:hypothetical protein n=1 Tax=Micromonospora sp. NPDC005173 TaxID=3157165 RepID=UPI0033BD7C39